MPAVCTKHEELQWIRCNTTGRVYFSITYTVPTQCIKWNSWLFPDQVRRYPPGPRLFQPCLSHFYVIFSWLLLPYIDYFPLPFIRTDKCACCTCISFSFLPLFVSIGIYWTHNNIPHTMWMIYQFPLTIKKISNFSPIFPDFPRQSDICSLPLVILSVLTTTLASISTV